MTLLICRTCPRYDTPRNGEFAAALKDALAHDPREVPIRKVQCLGGCPDHGVIALDAPGKARLRFAHLTHHDAAAIIDAAIAHHESPTGHPEDWTIPEPLTTRLTAVTAKAHRTAIRRPPAT